MRKANAARISNRPILLYLSSLYLVKDAVKKIDKAAANNLIHKNCAARKKSNLAKKVNA